MTNKMIKNIIITGTSRGIGFELVHLFANQGHNVLALSRNEQKVSNLNFDNIESFAFDLGKKADYKKVEDYVAKEWKQVDVLINNAGTLLNKPFSETTSDDFEYVYKTNVFGVAEMTRCVLPFMKKIVTLLPLAQWVVCKAVLSFQACLLTVQVKVLL